MDFGKKQNKTHASKVLHTHDMHTGDFTYFGYLDVPSGLYDITPHSRVTLVAPTGEQKVTHFGTIIIPISRNSFVKSNQPE